MKHLKFLGKFALLLCCIFPFALYLGTRPAEPDNTPMWQKAENSCIHYVAAAIFTGNQATPDYHRQESYYDKKRDVWIVRSYFTGVNLFNVQVEQPFICVLKYENNEFYPRRIYRE